MHDKQTTKTQSWEFSSKSYQDDVILNRILPATIDNNDETIHPLFNTKTFLFSAGMRLIGIRIETEATPINKELTIRCLAKGLQ